MEEVFRLERCVCVCVCGMHLHGVREVIFVRVGFLRSWLPRFEDRVTTSSIGRIFLPAAVLNGMEGWEGEGTSRADV
jgi:hypothetical protein